MTYLVDEILKGFEIGTTYNNYSFVAVDESFKKSPKTNVVFTTKGNSDANAIYIWIS